MRILCAIVGAQPLLMQTRETNSTKRRSVRSEFVGDDNLRNEGLMSKQCPQQPHRGGLVALELDQDLENLAFARQHATYTFAVQGLRRHFIDMPPSAGLRRRKFLAMIDLNLITTGGSTRC